jgi:hypothetical protein
MKLFSVQQIVTESSRAFRRFPLIILNAAAATISGLVLIEREGSPEPTILFNILFAAILGVPLLITIALTAEKRKWRTPVSLAVQVLGLIVLAVYAWTIPSDLANAPSIHVLRLLLLVVAMCFFAAVVPYSGIGETNGFWHYNKTLVLRLLISSFFSVILYVGLAVALAALNQLFGMDIPGKRYAELWILISGFFNTCLFLGGIPEQLDALDTSTEYPKGIKIFAQNILFPLVLVYLVILYVYMAKILIAWDWPKGWVSGLILGFSTAGMLMLLLLHPIQERMENVWVKSASRWFYNVMIPLVVMLLLAVWRRISEYGVTEGRYFAVAIGFWLAAIVLYFIFSKGKSFKVIPASLGFMSLFISFGPWGMFNVSESSQVTRLQELLTRASILVDGKIRSTEKPPPFSDTKEISSIIVYLHEVHGYDRIQPWFHESLKADSTEGRLSYKEPSVVTKMMGVEYVSVRMGTTTNEINLQADRDHAIDVRGFDKMWRTQIVTADQKRKEVGGGDLAYKASKGLDTLTLFAMQDGIVTDSVRVDMNAFIRRLHEEYKSANRTNVPPERMSLSVSGERMKVKVFVRHVFARQQDEVLKITSYDIAVVYSLEMDVQ